MGAVTPAAETLVFGDTPMRVSRSATADQSRGVVLFHHRTAFDGFTAAMTDGLTSAGWAVAAPDLFAHLPEGLEPDQLKRLLDDEWVLAAAADATGLLIDRGVESPAAVGFCMGGRLAFLAGAAGSVSAAVCFYGGDLDTGRGDAVAPVDRLGPDSASIQLHRGSRDSAATAEVQELVVTRADEVGASVEACTYAGARHAFLNRDDRERFSQRYAARAWGSALAFLDHTVGSKTR